VEEQPPDRAERHHDPGEERQKLSGHCSSPELPALMGKEGSSGARQGHDGRGDDHHEHDDDKPRKDVTLLQGIFV
jgi:hypothetical protein